VDLRFIETGNTPQKTLCAVAWNTKRVGTQIHSVIVFLFLYSPRCFHVFSVSRCSHTLSHSQCTTHLFIAYSYIWCPNLYGSQYSKSRRRHLLTEYLLIFDLILIAVVCACPLLTEADFVYIFVRDLLF